MFGPQRTHQSYDQFNEQEMWERGEARRDWEGGERSHEVTKVTEFLDLTTQTLRRPKLGEIFLGEFFPPYRQSNRSNTGTELEFQNRVWESTLHE